MTLRRMVHKPVVPLGAGATLYEEVAHFVHHMGNQLTILAMRSEVMALARKGRHAKMAAEKRSQHED